MAAGPNAREALLKAIEAAANEAQDDMKQGRPAAAVLAYAEAARAFGEAYTQIRTAD